MSKKKTTKSKTSVATPTEWLDWLWSKAWPLVAGGGLPVVIIAVMGWVNYSRQYQEELRHGDDLLRLGLYPQAKAAYQQAIKLHPLRHVVLVGKFFGDSADAAAQQIPDLLGMDHDAQWGLQKASAFDSADPQQIEAALKQLANSKPEDADIKTLLGIFHSGQMDFEQAEQDYLAALRQDPQNAEAHYGLGAIYWLQNRLADSESEYCQARDQSKNVPRYAINLAALYTEQKHYSKALDLLGGFNQDYPIAALETALVYRLQGKLKESQEWLNTALALMDNEQAKAKPDKQTPWQFKTQTALISLSKPNDKLYYLYASLAASQFLANDTANAKKTLAKARGLSDTHPTEIKELNSYDLNRLVEERPDLANKIKAFIQISLK